MKQINVTALFCESIREEMGGTYTLIGILPDNLTVEMERLPKGDGLQSGGPGLSRIWIYLRINFTPNYEFEGGIVRLQLPDGSIRDMMTIPAEVVRDARKSALEKGNAVAGVFSRIGVPTQVLQQGKITCEVEIGDEVYLAGGLNFLTVADEASSSTAT